MTSESTPVDDDRWEREVALVNAIVADATDILRREGDMTAVSIWQLIYELRDRYEQFCVTPDVERVLLVIEQLWEDPHVAQVDQGYIEFAWMDQPCPGCGRPLGDKAEVDG